MELTWPLVGRSAELARIAALLRSGPGAVVLAGAPGVGKTRLAAECLSRAEAAGYLALRVSATSATKAMPFGAFSSLLPDRMGGPTPGLLRQVGRSIAERGHGKPVAIMVDDAHLLDDSSAALTHHLVQSRATFVLTTLRSGHPASDAVVALWKDGLAERLEVGPLTFSQVEELLVAALGAPIEGASLSRFQDVAGGNALFLRELVMAALEAKSLRQMQGIWRLTGELPISDRLGEIIESRLANLSDEERRALGVVALGEPLSIGAFQSVEPDFDVEALERRGLVRLEKEDRRLYLRLDHPLHGEVLRSKLSQLAVRRIATKLADGVEGFGARRKTDVLPVGIWRLEGGGELDPDRMLRAALLAQQRNDFRLAERLVRAALTAGAGFDAAVLLGQLLWQQGRAENAERYLESLKPAATSDEQKVRLASVRIEAIDLGLNDFQAAIKVAEEAEASIEDVVLRDHITAEKARVLGRHGRNSEAVAIVDPLLDRTQGRTLVAACFAAATSMSMTGQFRRAVEATEIGYTAHCALTGPPEGYPPAMHLALRAQAYALAGYLSEGEELATAHYARGLSDQSPVAIAFFSGILAIHAGLQGRCQATARWGTEALAMFQRMGIPWMQRNALALVALGKAMQGSSDEARQALERLDGLGVPPQDYGGPLVLHAHAWTEVAAGDIPRAVEYLYEAVQLARWSGVKSYESWVLHDLARLGKAAEVAGSLQELSGLVEGPFHPARAAHAAALASAEAAGLEEASRAFEKIGALLLAAEAAADAAVLLRRDGDVRRAAAAGLRAETLAALCEGAVSPALAASTSVRALLTPRELEIARLAAAGMSDKRIAEQLFLSHRTVENKLHLVYAKLGVKGRAELGGVLLGR